MCFLKSKKDDAVAMRSTIATLVSPSELVIGVIGTDGGGEFDGHL